MSNSIKSVQQFSRESITDRQTESYFEIFIMNMDFNLFEMFNDYPYTLVPTFKNILD